MIGVAVGDEVDHLVVGVHGALDAAALQGRRDEGRIGEVLEVDLDAVLAEQVLLDRDIERRVADPGHGRERDLLLGAVPPMRRAATAPQARLRPANPNVRIPDKSRFNM